MATDAQTIASLAADALLGTLKLSVGDAIKLSGLYKRYASNPDLRSLAVEALAQELCERSPLTAGALCDAIAHKVGK